DHVIRRAAMPGSVVVFGEAVADLVAAGEKQQRIVPAGNQHRTGLARAPVFLADLAAVLARRDPQADAIGTLHHRAIGAAVDPALLRVAHDDQIVRAQIP